jgi:RHH-type proline utilization regulon transcriptional repressor/proline dehydrogenase/delta 1-pyrroline-5-carboxylate dehydrogenase
MKPPEEDDIRQVGRELAADLAPHSRGLRAVDDRALEVASHDAALRAALFRFVDVVPACRSFDDLAAHLVGYLGELDQRAVPIDLALKMGNTRAGRAALGSAAVAGVRHVAHRFIAAEGPREAEKALSALWEGGVAASLDLLGEATVTAPEADRYALRCRETLSVLADLYGRLPRRPSLERDSVGPIPRANLSVKVSALTPLLHPEAPELGERDAEPRLLELLRGAQACGAHLHVDTESFDTCEQVTDLVLSLLLREEFRDGPSVGIVLQAYLRDSPELCRRVLAWASSAGRSQPLVVRLVKGAYWDHEVVQASQQGWRSPVFEQKADCDRNFEALTLTLLDGRPFVRPAIASHNLRSVSYAIAADRSSGSPPGDLEFQVLKGLGDELSSALARAGHRVRAYCPVGDLVAGMAYLVRRLLENTANESFLVEHATGRPIDELLAAP